MSALPLESPRTTDAEVLHVCHIDETQQGDPLGGLGTWRDMPMMLWSIAKFATDHHVARSFPVAGQKYPPLDKFRSLFMYRMHPEYPRGRRTPMNVQEMVDRWVPIVRGLSAGHDKEEIDRCEFEMERHIMPMLAAPVAQLREFYTRLVEALKADRTIPMFVWTLFESWGEVILKKAPDGEIVTLKKKLAADIADMVEKDVHADLKEALMGALQWRGESQLRAVKASVEAGSKPRLRGRESCLFLVVNEGTPQQVEVML